MASRIRYRTATRSARGGGPPKMSENSGRPARSRPCGPPRPAKCASQNARCIDLSRGLARSLSLPTHRRDASYRYIYKIARSERQADRATLNQSPARWEETPPGRQGRQEDREDRGHRHAPRCVDSQAGSFNLVASLASWRFSPSHRRHRAADAPRGSPPTPRGSRDHFARGILFARHAVEQRVGGGATRLDELSQTSQMHPLVLPPRSIDAATPQ